MLVERLSSAKSPSGKMTWKQKLTLLLGREPVAGSLEYNKKVIGHSTIEDSAKDIFESLINTPAFSRKAKKLGLV